MRPKVLITDKIDIVQVISSQELADVDLGHPAAKDELAKIIGEYDGFLVRSQTKVTAKIIEVQKHEDNRQGGALAFDNVDLEAATNKGIIVCKFTGRQYNSCSRTNTRFNAFYDKIYTGSKRFN